jgi:hypothetical protein
VKLLLGDKGILTDVNLIESQEGFLGAKEMDGKVPFAEV